MKKMLLASLVALQAVIFGAFAMAQDISPPLLKLSVTLNGIENGQPIPEKFAYCAPDATAHTKEGGNVNPSIGWSGAPVTTKSYAVIVKDPDVPASFELANQPDKTIPADFPRQNFYHWLLVDIPPSLVGIAEGQDSKAIIPGGRMPGKADYGINGQNDYARDGKTQGGSYDGPCPPWNDERVHHYHFTVYALDIPSLSLSGNFTGPQAEAAMAGHILASGEVIGTYTQNQKLLK